MIATAQTNAGNSQLIGILVVSAVAALPWW